MKTAKKKVKLEHILFSPHLEEDEKIVFIVHRHPVGVIKNLLQMGLLGLVLPVFLWYLFPEVGLVFAIWIFVTVVRMALSVFIWYHDAILVTNVSLIDVRWNGPFDRTSTRLEYGQIEGTSCEVRGIVKTLLNYGLLKIDGAGVSIKLDDAIKPTDAEQVILQEQEKCSSAANSNNLKVFQDLLISIMSEHSKKMDA